MYESQTLKWFKRANAKRLPGTGMGEPELKEILNRRIIAYFVALYRRRKERLQ